MAKIPAHYLISQLGRDMEARLPPDKLSFLLELLEEWRSISRCTLRQLQELTGYLQFTSQVIPMARAFLRAL